MSKKIRGVAIAGLFALSAIVGAMSTATPGFAQSAGASAGNGGGNGGGGDAGANGREEPLLSVVRPHRPGRRPRPVVQKIKDGCPTNHVYMIDRGRTVVCRQQNQ